MKAVGNDSRPFRVKRVPTGEVFEIPADKTILHVLQDAGLDLPSSCESGTCGTCRMKLISGAVNHRDLFLAEDEKGRFIMPCVSRASGDEIELDF